MNRGRRVGIVGGGVLGATLALRLSQAGLQVTLLERAPSIGGLAGAMDFGGHAVDRFYHVIVPTDDRMIDTARELGLGDELHFAPVGAGFLVDGELHDLNGLADFLRFSPLTPAQRLRLAWFVGQCQLRSSYDALDDIPLETWLRRHCGSGVYERIWKPLLDSRFEGNHSELPATYIWSRTKRMSGARGAGDRRETMGALRGGHQRLIDAMAERAVELGAQLRLSAGVEGLARDDDGRVTGVLVDGEAEPFDLTIATLQPPGLRRLLPEPLQPLLAPYPTRFMGCVCLVLKVRRPLLPYYALNICDPSPITSVIEMSHVTGTEHTDGLRLVYVPRYCDPGAPEQTEADDSVYTRFTDMLSTIVPDFSRDEVVDWTVQRTPLVESVHPVGARPRLAPIWPGADGLALASNAQVYPRVLSGQSVMSFAESVAGQVTSRLGAAR